MNDKGAHSLRHGVPSLAVDRNRSHSADGWTEFFTQSRGDAEEEKTIQVRISESSHYKRSISCIFNKIFQTRIDRMSRILNLAHHG